MVATLQVFQPQRRQVTLLHAYTHILTQKRYFIDELHSSFQQHTDLETISLSNMSRGTITVHMYYTAVV